MFFIFLFSISLPTINKYINNDSGSTTFNSPMNQKDSLESAKKMNISLNLSGYCYNPELPELGSDYENRTIDLEELTGKELCMVVERSYTFSYQDDHCDSIHEYNTGDVFTIRSYGINKTNGEIMDYFEEDSSGFSDMGGSILKMTSYCSNDGRGPYYDSTWFFDIEISDCGEYPKYTRLGLFTEPDQGNEWNMDVEFEFMYVE